MKQFKDQATQCLGNGFHTLSLLSVVSRVVAPARAALGWLGEKSLNMSLVREISVLELTPDILDWSGWLGNDFITQK